MGIKTVAVFSEADSKSVHVRMADEAVCVGPPPSSQSYLAIPSIIDAIKTTGAQAVHPGYGFLSENYQFCEALKNIGVTFIGPSVEAMEGMGDKIRSKLIAKKAGVHIIPGYEGVIENEDHAIELAKTIGYPVMLKASAGGGGKGMRIAWNEREIRENFKVAAAESKASFSDDRLLIEKFIEEPRHIEFQIIADQHGKTLYLPERECSIQRRNQKVVEEAPSVALDPDLREAMGKQAVQLAKAVKYCSAGTVEFLLDAKTKDFYFLEMNTRLQVEHPITEYITGIDLVEQMIRVAAGQKLALNQKDISINGWAVESRVYAEDPKTYLPCIGKLKKYEEPGKRDPNVRCDSGIAEGSSISIYYDPMICKLSTHGANRNEALDRMATALDSYVIQGVIHNIPLLREVIGHDRFRSGNISTKFLAEEFPQGFQGHSLTDKEFEILSEVASAVYWKIADQDHSHGKAPREPLVIKLGDKEALVKDSDLEIEWVPGSPLIRVNLPEGQVTLQYLEGRKPGKLTIQYLGTIYELTVWNEREWQLSKFMIDPKSADHSNLVISPMPGQIVNLHVKEGDTVQEGAELLVMEAMKMQNVIRAPKSGRIKSVLIKSGQNVIADQELIKFAD